MKPIMKWAGGKARLAPQIADAFARRCEGVYFEPFVGSGAVFLHLRSRGLVGRAVLADVNAKLVEVHKAVRDGVDAVLEALDELPGEDWRERYYVIRERYNTGPWTGPAHAARFLWLNRAAFNGLYRENRAGWFNVPLGRYKRLSFPSRIAFRAVSGLLSGVDLVCADFSQVMAEARGGDHVYCDPPYVPMSKTACFEGYCPPPFGLAEQRELASCARMAASRGAHVVLSNHDLPVVRDELYPESRGFRHFAKPSVARAISQKASGRGAVAEIIATIGPWAT